jgi:hypothetical protein
VIVSFRNKGPAPFRIQEVCDCGALLNNINLEAANMAALRMDCAARRSMNDDSETKIPAEEA